MQWLFRRAHTGEDAFQGPLHPNWTVIDLAEWIGETDDGCHDPRALVVLRAIDRSIVPSASAPAAAVVLVRSLVAHVSADPALGTRRLGEFVVEPPAPTLERARSLAAV